MGKSVCPVCNVFLPSEENKAAHMVGKKHLSRVAIQEARSKAAAKSVFVTGFREGTVDLALMDYFNKFGPVSKVILDKEKGRYAIVEFTTEEAAKLAIHEVPHNLQGRRLLVKPRELKPIRGGNSHEKQSSAVKHETLMTKLQSQPSVISQMQALVELMSLTPSDLSQRESLRAMLQSILSEFFPECVVHLFGSTVSGLGFKGCDVDILLELSGEQDVSSESLSCPESGDVPTVEQLRTGAVNKEQLWCLPLRSQLYFIKRVISKMLPSAKKVLFISARCPIVRFYYANLGISCDLSCKDKLSIYNTQLLKLYCSLDERVTPLMMTLRYWAKSQQLTGSGHLLSNYAFTLMVLFFLQTREPPVVCSVQALKQLADDRTEAGGWDCSFCTDPDRIPKSENQQPLDELLREFFEFFASFDFTLHIISTKEGKKVAKSAIMASEEPYAKNFKFGPLCIQDPFDLGHNVAANVNDAHLASIMEHIEKSRAICGHDGFKQKGLLELLSATSPKHSTSPRKAEPEKQPEKKLSFDIPLTGAMVESVLRTSSKEATEDETKQKCLEKVCEHVVNIFAKGFLFECKVLDSHNCILVPGSRKRSRHKDLNKEEEEDVTLKKQHLDNDNIQADDSDVDVMQNEGISDETLVPLLSVYCRGYHKTWYGRRKIRRECASAEPDKEDPLSIEARISEKIVEQVAGFKPEEPLMAFKCLLSTKKTKPVTGILAEFVPILNEKEFKGAVFTFLKSSLPKLIAQCMGAASGQND